MYRTANVVALLLALTACNSLGGAPAISTQEVLQHAFAIVEVVGDTAVRVKGYALLQKYAPEAIPLIDVPHPQLDGNGQPVLDPLGNPVMTPADHIITIAELKAAGQLLIAQPELVAGLLAAAYMLRKG